MQEKYEIELSGKAISLLENIEDVIRDVNIYKEKFKRTNYCKKICSTNKWKNKDIKIYSAKIYDYWG